MKKLISHKAQLILIVCTNAGEPISAPDLSDVIIEHSIEYNRFGPVGTFLYRYFDIALMPWLTVTMSPAFLTECLEELVMSGRLVEQGKFPNLRYTITNRGRRTMRVIQNWEARADRKARSSKTQLA